MFKSEGNAIRKIEMTDTNPLDFNRNHYQPKVPLHIRRTTDNWKTHQWSPDYLKSIVGHRLAEVSYNSAGVFDYNQHATTGVVRKKSMPFKDAIDLIFSDAGRMYYVQQQDIKKQFPDLLRDIVIPQLLDRWKVVDLTNLWFGGRGCKTPLHFDNSHNFLVQVTGRKRVFLFPSTQDNNLYPAVNDLLPHCSRVNVFSPDRSQFPLYADAEKHKRELDLEPGDTLYIPIGWWHAVESLEPSISVNFWWHGLI